MQTFALWEASGIIASRQNPGVLWSHNDSGYPGSVFALSTNGASLARYWIPDVFGGDFEDIAVGPGPRPEFQYIYLGDIGDNYTNRPNIRVFRFPEPAVYLYQSALPRDEPIVGAQEIVLTYPDAPFNAEAMMVDPITGDLYLATKFTNNSRIYRATRAQMDSGTPVTLSFVRQIGFQKVSGGDVSADGKLVALRRGNNAARWTRSAGQSVGDALGGNSTAIPVLGDPFELNGEALGFHPTGLGYYTLGEGYNQPIMFFRRTDTGVPRQPLVLIAPGSEWRYQDLGHDEGTAWRGPTFDDSEWASGPAQLGYGQGDEQTVISFGFDDFFKNTTTYFRRSFTLGAGVTLTNLALRVCFTDGIAVYLNGTNVLRLNLPPGPTFGEASVSSNAERQNYWYSYPVTPSLVRAGTNTIAVELHRFDPMGPDLSFDLQLLEATVGLTPQFTGVPRLSGGIWRFGLAGTPGLTVTVEASGDLVNWSSAGQVTLTNGTGQFQENAVPGRAQRFYRIQ